MSENEARPLELVVVVVVCYRVCGSRVAFIFMIFMFLSVAVLSLCCALCEKMSLQDL